MRFPSPEEWLQFPDEWLEALCGEEFSGAQPASVDLAQREAPSWSRRHSLSDLPRGERRLRAEVNTALSNASPNAHAMTVPLVTQGGQGTSGRKAATEDRAADAVALLEEAIARGVNAVEVKAALLEARGELARLTGDANLCAGGKLERARCLARLSLTAIQKENHEAAMAHARAAAAAAPDEPEVRSALFYALLARVDVASRKGDCQGAEAAAREAALYATAVNDGRLHVKRLVGACLAESAGAAYAAEQWDDAERLLRRARLFIPDDASVLNNLARVSTAKAIAHAQAFRCDDARADVAEVRRLGLDQEARATKVLAVCWSNKAIQLAKEGKYREAVAASRLGLHEAPTDEVLQKNLEIFLLNWMVGLLEKNDCAEARALLPELATPALEKVKKSVQSQCAAASPARRRRPRP